MLGLSFIIFFLSLMALLFFVGMTLAMKLNGNGMSYKANLKRMKIALGVTLASFVISLALSSGEAEPEIAEADKKAESEETKKATEVTEEEKAEVEAKAKEDAEKKAEEARARKEKEDIEKAEKEKADAERALYVETLKPEIDLVMEKFDSVWADLWTETFEGVSNGTVDIYEGYESMKNLRYEYDLIQKEFESLPTDGLSTENQDLLNEFNDNLSTASYTRKIAAEQAMEMFDKSDFSPSTMDSILSEVETSDSIMLSGIVSLTQLEQNLDVER